MQGLMLNAYDNLYRYQGESAQDRALLAESHTVSAGRSRLGIQAQAQRQVPRRSPLTAEDVVYSFRRVLALAWHLQRLPQILKPESITAVDSAHRALQAREHPMRVLCRDPQHQHRQSTGHQGQREDGDWAKAWLASNGAGSGAYKIVPAGYRPLEYLDMEINPDTSSAGRTPQGGEKIAFRPVRETSTRILALLKRHDRLHGYQPAGDQVAQINGVEDRLRARRTLVMRTFIIRMNNTKPRSTTSTPQGLRSRFNYMGFINDNLAVYATRDPYPMPTISGGFPRT